jgi:hypothetical protein
MLSVAMLFAAGSAFVSCKDYDDDIKNLQGQIDGLKQTIEAIQGQIAKGYLLESVTQTDGGVVITINGKNYNITNGKDGAAGKDGDVWTIVDGFWYKNGVKYTDAQNPDGIKAKGEKGDTGATGATGPQGPEGPQGPQGASGGKDGKDGVYYIPGEDGYFYKVDPNTGEKTKTDIKWSTGGGGATGTPVVDAAWDDKNNKLVLTGLVDSNGNVTAVTIDLNGSLTSLVKVQHYYLDGIETQVYPWIGDTILKKSNLYGVSNTITADHHGKTIKQTTKELFDFLPNTLARHDKEVTTKSASAITRWIYGPVWPMDYHLNPANAQVSYSASAPKFNVLEPDVIYTRASAATLNITSPEKYGYFSNPDKAVFGADKGIVTVGLKIEHPEYLEPSPTDLAVNGATAYDDTWDGHWYSDWYLRERGHVKDDIIALQMKNNDGEYITSDYVLLQPLRIDLEGLIWVEKPDYKEPGLVDGEKIFKGGPGNRNGDEEGWANASCEANRIHVWDSPEEALADPDGAALELFVENTTLNIKEKLGIHYISENYLGQRTVETLKAKTADEEAWGLHYEFQLVDYEVSGNETHDSRYVSFCDKEGNIAELQAAQKGTLDTDGIIRVLNVDEKKQALDTKEYNTTSIGREPLVRVLVKNNHKNAQGEYDQVLLDGYILIHITTTPENINVTSYPIADLDKFKACTGYVDYETDWAQFNAFILTQTLKGMTKETFDGFYYADCYEGGTVSAADQGLVTPDALRLTGAIDGNNGYSMKIFNFGDMYGLNADGSVALPPVRGDKAAEASNAFEDAALGTVVYYPNHNNSTNHRWIWRLTQEELEYLTHHNSKATQVTRWIRFKAKNYYPDLYNVDVDNNYAPYPYIWVKMTVNVSRDAKQYIYKEKNDNYWFHYNTGASDGWAGWPIDIQAPGNISMPTIAGRDWNARPSTTLITNKIQINGKTKYYFAPKTYTITTLEGNTYTITPQRNANDKTFDRLYCKYVSKNMVFNKTPDLDVYVGAVVVAKDDAKNSEESHKWEEAKLEEIMNQCYIDYDRGALINYELYAKKGNTYTLIATITDPEQIKGDAATELAAGNIKLEKNDVAKEVLNAIGYPTKEDGTCDFGNSRKNINKQMRAWLGTVHDAGCKVAEYVSMEKTDDANVATFLASWERPINLAPFTPDVLLDANTNENWVYVLDYLHLYDWRGDKGNQGYMYDNHWWFWGYYNVKSITVDMRPDHVYTNMHKDQRSTEWVKLSQVTTTANLWTWDADGNRNNLAAQETTFNFGNDLQANQYYLEEKEAALEAFMGIKPVNEAKKAKFGGFYYANNGDNVDEFDIRIPITIEYEWGKLYQVVQWKIKTTHGR